MKEIRYVDATKLQYSAIFCMDYELISAGTTISSMPEAYRDDTYERLADLYDIRFIFDNYVPKVNFYAVPRVDIFATDSNNGYWGTLGNTTDITNMDDQICYISNQNEIFIVAENLESFIFPIDSINKRLPKITNKTDTVVLYYSKEDAMKAVKFTDIPTTE